TPASQPSAQPGATTQPGVTPQPGAAAPPSVTPQAGATTQPGASAQPTATTSSAGPQQASAGTQQAPGTQPGSPAQQGPQQQSGQPAARQTGAAPAPSTTPTPSPAAQTTGQPPTSAATPESTPATGPATTAAPAASGPVQQSTDDRRTSAEAARPGQPVRTDRPDPSDVRWQPLARPGQPVARMAGGLPLQDVRTPDEIPAGAADVHRLLMWVPVDASGRPLPFPDPAGIWAGYVNDGGPTVTGRATNCDDAANAGLSTWFGDPAVAAAFVGRGGVPARRTEAWLGAPYTRVSDGRTGLTDVEAALAALAQNAPDRTGPAATLLVRVPGSAVAHRYNVYVSNGVLTYVDHVTGRSWRVDTANPASAQRPPIADGQQIFAVVLDQNRAVAPIAAHAAGTHNPQLDYTLAAGRPTAPRAGDLLTQLSTLLDPDRTVPAADVLDEIEAILAAMGVRPGGTPVRWAHLRSMVPATTPENDALLALLHEAGWRTAYERAAAASEAVAAALTGDPNESPGRTVALATIFAANPAPTFLPRVDTDALDLVTGLLRADFRFTDPVTVTAGPQGLDVTFDEATRGRVRVDYAVLPAGTRVRLDWDADAGAFRLTVGHDEDVSDPEIRMRLALALGRVALGPSEFRADDRDDNDLFLDVLQAYSYVGISDVGHTLAANRPSGSTGTDADAAAAVRLTQQARDDADRVLRTVLAAVTVDPAVAAV
ncbi:MAG: hypothetical protein HOV79_34265, partial [Hamadaea sp.]|nr:hypothetical protein [Hamadaea sp.]